ncbi:MAG: Gfo/Idh/MocA family oxidoreductase [Dehalococcoidia bacterium]|nr:Gfo/Idh/MocA family oxidoreductase [Dehalococcoidia bacterium]
MTRKSSLLSIGVIGVGSIGQHHARIMAALPEVRFVGVADANPQQAQAIASRYGVQAFQDYMDLLDAVSAVTVAVPTPLHYSVGMECLRRGIHVLMEKPLAESVAQARELAEAASKARKVLQVGHVERFNPTFTELANVLTGEHLLALEARRLSPFLERAAGVSAVLDLMVHDLDLVMKLVGSPVAGIQARGIRAKVPLLDHVSANLVFENGVLASLTASKISQQKVREITAICEGCVVHADLLARTVVIHRQATSQFQSENERVLYRQEGLVEQVYVPSVEPLYAELAHFVDCVRHNRQPLVGADDAMRVLEVAEAIEAAAEASVVKPRLAPNRKKEATQ